MLILPYFIFWFSYVTYFIFFWYCLFYVKYYTIYFPEDTEWVLVNFLWVLPRRMAFKSIYFIRDLSLKSLFLLLYYISIFIIIGLPIVFINIFLSYFKIRDINKVWDEMSPFTNLKLLVRDGKLTRNMKKGFIDGSKRYNDVMSKGVCVKQGLLTTHKNRGDVTHAVSYVGDFGILHTSKDQKCNHALIIKNNQGFSYVQGFGINKMTDKNLIKNPNLFNLLNGDSAMSAIYAHARIPNLSNRMIIINDNNRQFSRYPTSNEITESKLFISNLGGVDVVNKALQYSIDYNILLNSARKMLYILDNSSSSSRYSKYIENKGTYDMIIELDKSQPLDKNSELFKIKTKIDSLLNELL